MEETSSFFKKQIKLNNKHLLRQSMTIMFIWDNTLNMNAKYFCICVDEWGLL